MPTPQVTDSTEAGGRAYQRAIDHAAEMLRVAQACPDEQLVEACQGIALDTGRRSLRDSLQDAAQARVDAVEKKGRAPRPSIAAMPGPARGGGNARS